MGPMLAAVLLVWRKEGVTGVRRLGASLASPGRGLYWIAALTVPIFFLYWGWDVSNETISLSELSVRFASLLFFTGIGEEVGWRGFVLPRFQARMNALASSALLVLPWALWHLPRLITQRDQAPEHLVAWVIVMLFVSIILTWFFNSSGGSLLVPGLFHSTYDVAHQYSGRGLMDLFMVIAGVTIIIVRGRENMSRMPRVTAS